MLLTKPGKRPKEMGCNPYLCRLGVKNSIQTHAVCLATAADSLAEDQLRHGALQQDIV